MSVDSKGLCQTKNKDVFYICSKIEDAVNKLISPKGRLALIQSKDKKNSLVRTEIIPFLEMVRMRFMIDGEKRMLTIHFGCDSDENQQFPGKKILWSVGYWGRAVAIMNAVGQAMKTEGDVFLDLCDCDDEGYEPIDEVMHEENIHLAHCGQGEYKDSCKYGDPTCSVMLLKAKAKRAGKKLRIS